MLPLKDDCPGRENSASNMRWYKSTNMRMADFLALRAFVLSGLVRRFVRGWWIYHCGYVFNEMA